MSHRPIDKNRIEDVIGLIPMQEGMLYNYLRNPESDQYLEQYTYILNGYLDISVCISAWNWVISQNEMLRTTFRWEKISSPVQIVLKEIPLSICVHDLSLMTEEGKNKALQEIRQMERTKRFDLDQDSLFRISLCRLAEDRFAINVSNHHIIYDGWSNGIILGEFIKSYTTLKSGTKPEVQKKPHFKNYVKWLKGQDTNGREHYWKNYLDGYVFQPLLLPDGTTVKENTGTLCDTCIVAKELICSLEYTAKREGVTLGEIFTVAWGLLLQILSSRNDVLFGTVVSGRSAEVNGIEGMVGLLMNTVPVRIRSTKECSSIKEVLMDVHKTNKYRQPYEMTSLVDIQTYANQKNMNDLFDTLLVIENYPLDINLDSELHLEKFIGYSVTNYSILLAINNFKETSINFIFDNRKYQEETIWLLKERYIALLKLITVDIELPIKKIRCLTEIEKELDCVWNIEFDYKFDN